jgi:putative heme-binding domain-containing protein
VVAIYDQLNPGTRTAAQALLASRAGWARAWLRAMREGKTKPEATPPGALSPWQARGDEEVTRLMKELWGKRGKPTTAQMQEQIQRLAGVVNSGSGSPYNGRTLFQSHCAVCHTLFGLGAQVGPDLTSYKRDDLQTMLVNIINPSAEIREGYENHLVETKDDRSLSGFLVEQNNQVVVLRGLDGQNTTLSRKDITRMETSGLSVMPEGLLDTLKEPEIRDLFAYLRSSQPLVGSPPEK